MRGPGPAPSEPTTKVAGGAMQAVTSTAETVLLIPARGHATACNPGYFSGTFSNELLFPSLLRDVIL